jgi:hypothetical protein
MYRVEEKFGGKRLRCPSCSASFVIPTEEEIPVEVVSEPSLPPRRSPERAEDDRPGGDLDPGWITTRKGLRVVGTSLLIYVVLLAVNLGLALLVLGTPVLRGRGDVLAAANVAFFLGCIAVAILWVVGQAMCCAAPGGARVLATISLVLTVSAILVMVVWFISLFPGKAPGEPPPKDTKTLSHTLLGLGALVGLGAQIVFMFLLRSIAVSFRRTSLAGQVTAFVILEIVFLAASIGLGAVFQLAKWDLGRAGDGPLPFGKTAVAVCLVLAFLTYLVWFLYLVSATRSAIPAWPHGRRRLADR